MSYEIKKSAVVYSGNFLSVKRDRVLYPSGKHQDVEIVQHPGAAVVIPVDGQERLLFVRQYRHGCQDFLIEFPAGTLEPGESPAACAARELREETGYASDSIEKLGAFFMSPGYSTEFIHVYVAQNLIRDPLDGDEDEDLEVLSYTRNQALELAMSDRIRDGKTLASLFLLANRSIADNH